MLTCLTMRSQYFAARLLMSVSERCIQISQQKHAKCVVSLVSIIDDNCSILKACEVWKYARLWDLL